MRNLFLLILIIHFQFFANAQEYKFRANFKEVKIENDVKQYESTSILILNLESLTLKVFDNVSETYNIYKSFEIDDHTTMFPSIDKNNNEFAIELDFQEEYIYITIQNATENKIGAYDHIQYVCKRLIE
jgi:hypothetical protein